MKFTINKETMLSGLKYVTNIISSYNINPVLNNIKIECNEDKVSLSSISENLVTKFDINQKVSINKTGTIYVKGKILYNIVSKISEESIDFEVVDKTIIRITTKNYSCDVNLSDEESFPIVEFKVQEWEKFIFKGSFVNRIVKSIAPCAALIFYGASILNGILFDSTREDGFVEVMASDGFKLSYLKQKYSGPKFKFVIKTDNLKQIIEQVKNDSDVVFYINENNLVINVKNVWLSCRLFENQYPAAIKTIEQKYEKSFLISTSVLINALERGTNLLIGDKKPAVQINIKKENIAINFRSIEFGSSYEEIPIESYTGEPMSISVNVKYLVELLKMFDVSKIKLEVESPIKPIFVKNPNDNEYLTLVLPIKSI